MTDTKKTDTKKSASEVLQHLIKENLPQLEQLRKRREELIREQQEVSGQISTLSGVIQGWEVALNVINTEEKKPATPEAPPAPTATTEAPPAATTEQTTATGEAPAAA